MQTENKTKVKQLKALIRDMALKNPDSKPWKILLECTRDSEEIVAYLPTKNVPRQLCSRAKIDTFREIKAMIFA